MKGLFIPGITAEMFRNGCLEGIEALMAEGEIYDIDYDPEQHWIPCSERLPGEYMSFYATVKSLVDNRERWVIEGMYTRIWQWGKIPMIDRGEAEVIAWMPKYLPEPWRGDAE